MKLLLQTLSFLFGILFFVSAGLQYNDPDPLHWMFLYGAAGVVVWISVFTSFPRSGVYFVLGAAFLQLLIVADGALVWFRTGSEHLLNTPMSETKPYIEDTREFFGSLIVFCYLSFLLYLNRQQRKSNA